MNNDTKTCYDTAEANLFTRFETPDQGVFALPCSALMSVHLPPSAHGVPETLSLVYVTHVVTIQGTHLSPLLLVIEKGRAEAIRVGGGQSGGSTTPTVRDITVADPA